MSIVPMEETKSSASLKVKLGTRMVDQIIYDAILKAVAGQRLPPGTKLTEASLCDLFAVSRTTVRKAIQRLAHDNILELQPNRGAFIAQPTPHETREIFSARRAIEAAILPIAIASITRAQVADLRAAIRHEHEAYHGGDYAKWIRLGGEFHMQLACMAGNHTLTRFLRELVSRCSLIIALYQAPGTTFCPNEGHAELIDAIEAGDIPLAIARMTQHLLDIERSLRLDGGIREVNLADALVF